MMYPAKLLIPLYRKLLKLSKGRGEHLLAKVDASLFKTEREIYFGKRTDISIVIPPDPHFIRFLLQTHEKHITKVINSLVQKGDTVVDIGANIGYFSALGTDAVGRQGKVYCFEPEQRNFEILRKNCLILQKRGYSSLPFQLAVSSKSGKAMLRIHRFSTYHSIEGSSHFLDRVENTQEINTIALDEWAVTQGVNNISFLKVDTEGHEPQVLDGARGLFRNGRVKCAILECRDESSAEYVDHYCHEYDLSCLIWDGKTWCQGPLNKVFIKIECLLSKNTISPSQIM